MRWLPSEFNGVRTAEDVLDDLVAVASAPGALREAHLSFRPKDGHLIRGSKTIGATGPLSTSRIGACALRLRMVDLDLGIIDARQVMGGWLRTYDGADYYSLRVDLGDTILTLRDAYND